MGSVNQGPCGERFLLGWRCAFRGQKKDPLRSYKRGSQWRRKLGTRGGGDIYMEVIGSLALYFGKGGKRGPGRYGQSLGEGRSSREGGEKIIFGGGGGKNPTVEIECWEKKKEWGARGKSNQQGNSSLLSEGQKTRHRLLKDGGKYASIRSCFLVDSVNSASEGPSMRRG